MITFHDMRAETDELGKAIAERIRLIRALANFHVEHQASDPEQDLVNQRIQIIKSVRRLENDFQKLMTTWQKVLEELNTQVAYEPEDDVHSDLLSQFIKTTVPAHMQSVWKPGSFTGSLLVLFVDGEVESSSLVEKKDRPEEGQNSPVTAKVENHKANENDVSRFVSEPRAESFTILKSLGNSDINFYFYLPEPEKVIIKIYNQMDQLVRLIEKRYDQPGDYAAIWDGFDNDGEPLPKDTYYCQLQIGNALSELRTIELT
ncbi:MAG: FlgD immunoglobulin-like domain containing protein [bacterium]